MGIRITGAETVKARFARVGVNLANLQPALEREASAVRDLIRDAEGGRTSPAGNRWEALQEEGAASRFGARRSTGRRLRATRARSRRGSRGSGRRLEGSQQVTTAQRSITVTVPVPQASFQYFGTEDVPARNALPFERVGRGLVVPGTGAAGEWFEAMLGRVKAFIVAEVV